MISPDVKRMLSASEKALRVHFAAFWWCGTSLTSSSYNRVLLLPKPTGPSVSSLTLQSYLFFTTPGWQIQPAIKQHARGGEGKKKKKEEAWASLNDAMTNSLEARCYLPDAWQCTDAACFSLPLFSFALFLAHFLRWWIRGVTRELVAHADSRCICILHLIYCTACFLL